MTEIVLSTLAGKSCDEGHNLTVSNLCEVAPACLYAVVVMNSASVESISDKATGIRSQMLVITDAMNLASVAFIRG